MDSGEIAEVKIAFETQIWGDLRVGFLLRYVFTEEGMCLLFLFRLISHLVLSEVFSRLSPWTFPVCSSLWLSRPFQYLLLWDS